MTRKEYQREEREGRLEMITVQPIPENEYNKAISFKRKKRKKKPSRTCTYAIVILLSALIIGVAVFAGIYFSRIHIEENNKSSESIEINKIKRDHARELKELTYKNEKELKEKEKKIKELKELLGIEDDDEPDDGTSFRGLPTTNDSGTDCFLISIINVLWNTNLTKKCEEFKTKNGIKSSMMSFICNALTSKYKDKKVRVEQIANIRNELKIPGNSEMVEPTEVNLVTGYQMKQYDVLDIVYFVAGDKINNVRFKSQIKTDLIKPLLLYEIPFTEEEGTLKIPIENLKMVKVMVIKKDDQYTFYKSSKIPTQKVIKEGETILIGYNGDNEQENAKITINGKSPENTYSNYEYAYIYSSEGDDNITMTTDGAKPMDFHAKLTRNKQQDFGDTLGDMFRASQVDEVMMDEIDQNIIMAGLSNGDEDPSGRTTEVDGTKVIFNKFPDENKKFFILARDEEAPPPIVFEPTINEVKYTLVGGAVHLGNHSSGHYYTFLQNIETGKWIKVNDAKQEKIETAIGSVWEANPPTFLLYRKNDIRTEK